MQLTSIEGSGGQIIQGNEAEALIAECLAEYEGGSEAALYTLGVAFSTGSHGVVCDLIEAHQIQCEALRNGTLHCAHAPAGQRDLQARHDQLRAIGAPVTLLDAAEARARVG